MDQLIACVAGVIILQLKELVFSVRGTGLISLPSRADFCVCSSPHEYFISHLMRRFARLPHKAQRAVFGSGCQIFSAPVPVSSTESIVGRFSL